MSVPNFNSLARLEVPEKFLWGCGVGGVCKVIFVSNPTTVLRLCYVVLLGLGLWQKLKLINLHGCKSNITEPVLILDTVREFLIIDHLPIAPVVVKRLDGATLCHVVSETARGSQQFRISTWQLDNLTVESINFLLILFNLHHIPLLSTWPCLQQTQCWRWSLHRQ